TLGLSFVFEFRGGSVTSSSFRLQFTASEKVNSFLIINPYWMFCS
ncbi:hypothetical protein MTR67_019313, partial [Solanum verrucosum]